jgi:hypothetical protein
VIIPYLPIHHGNQSPALRYGKYKFQISCMHSVNANVYNIFRFCMQLLDMKNNQSKFSVGKMGEWYGGVIFEWFKHTIECCSTYKSCKIEFLRHMQCHKSEHILAEK